MIRYPHPIIAKEGWIFIITSGIISLLIHFFFGWSLSWFFWIIFFFIVQFFRDPIRSMPIDKNAVLSPADGRIIAVENSLDPYAKRESLRISVFMNIFNVHSNRMSIDGVVKEIQYFPGKFLNASLDKSSEENERNVVIVESNGHTITLVQIAGFIARRILCYIKVGDFLKKGDRYGFIRFGSRVDIYLPIYAKPTVTIGEKVFATSTILARIPD